MKYRLTPCNTFFLFVAGIFIYYKINPGNAHDALGVSYIFVFAILVLLADLLLQYFIKSYKKLLLIEFIGLPASIIIGLSA